MEERKRLPPLPIPASEYALRFAAGTCEAADGYEEAAAHRRGPA
jgi:hypothetical protein